ncbi:MAG: hypothetical protein HN368_17845 [Spirochaetales bacterium]|jgi:uncharacterized protein|nr:hypothetical protein [Spirochaetales bacterium]
MKQYMYRIQPSRPEMLRNGPTDEEAAVVTEHFAYLKDLNEKGTVTLAGRTLNTDPSSFGIVILKADNDEQAKQIMDDDPAVVKGVMTSEIFPFRTSLFSELYPDDL